MFYKTDINPDGLEIFFVKFSKDYPGYVKQLKIIEDKYKMKYRTFADSYWEGNEASELDVVISILKNDDDD
jgi:hypothetical protein